MSYIVACHYWTCRTQTFPLKYRICCTFLFKQLYQAEHSHVSNWSVPLETHSLPWQFQTAIPKLPPACQLHYLLVNSSVKGNSSVNPATNVCLLHRLIFRKCSTITWMRNQKISTRMFGSFLVLWMILQPPECMRNLIVCNGKNDYFFSTIG